MQPSLDDCAVRVQWFSSVSTNKRIKCLAQGHNAVIPGGESAIETHSSLVIRVSVVFYRMHTPDRGLGLLPH